MFFKNKLSDFYIVQFAFCLLIVVSSKLHAANDSTAGKTGICLGINLTKTNVKSNLKFNGDEIKNAGYGIFAGGLYSKKCFKKLIFDARLILEERRTSDKQDLVFTLITGDIIGQVIPVQKNYCLVISPLFCYAFNNSLSAGIGPSLNYLLRSTYKFQDLVGNTQHPNLYYYKKLQPEINANVEITIKKIVLSFDYSISMINKVRVNATAVKEYDGVFRFGIGYLFSSKK